jgi:hypothetical protein
MYAALPRKLLIGTTPTTGCRYCYPDSHRRQTCLQRVPASPDTHAHNRSPPSARVDRARQQRAQMQYASAETTISLVHEKSARTPRVPKMLANAVALGGSGVRRL